MMLLWISGRIVTYWYHYLTSWGFTLLLLAGVTARLDRRYSKHVLIFVLLVLAVSIYFAPVWAELPISLAAAHRRLIFPLVAIASAATERAADASTPMTRS